MTDNLTDAQISEYNEAFQLFDKNGDGHITSSEIGNVMKSLGQNLTDEELEKMVGEIDADSDGKVGFNEFIELMIRNMNRTNNKEELKQAFRVLDKDNKGFINASEIKYALENLGEDVTAEELQEMMDEVNVYNNGQISFDEFLNMLS